jgi:endoribonuclease Dicer
MVSNCSCADLQVALTFLTSLRNDERVNHQLDVKFQESYLRKVCILLRCNLSEGAVGSNKDAADILGSQGDEGEKLEEPMDVEEGELPDTQGLDTIDALSASLALDMSFSGKLICSML